MAVVYPYDKLFTDYIIKSKVGKFRGYLTECVESGDTVDLYASYLSPEAAHVLNGFYGTVDFINSQNAELDALLKRNMEAVREEEEKYPVLSIPNNPTMDDFSELFKSIKSGEKVSIDKPYLNRRQSALVTFLIIGRPDVEFDIHTCAVNVYLFIKDEWILGAQPHDEYIEFIDGTVRPMTVKNGKLGTPSHGYLPADMYVKRFKVLPMDFGTKNLIQIENGKVVGEWANVVNLCINVLSVEKEHKKKLSEYLQFREGNN